VAYVLSDLSEAHYTYFASLKGIAGHLKDGLFVTEGPKIVESVLRSSAEVPFALMTREFFEHFEPLLQARAGTPTQIHLALKPEMEKIVGYPLHQGVMLAVCIPEPPALTTITEGVGSKTVVILEGMADAENMGTVIRTAAGFGVDAVIVDQTCCHPFLRRAVRVSMGTVINVPIIRTHDLPGVLQELKSASFQLVAAALSDASVPLTEVGWKERSAIILGAESVGLSDQTIGSADITAMIPMAKDIDSFNVGVASGIFLHERFASQVRSKS
jgi:tRNA G18 (ribose-2'-O)-methylase SpoU